MAALHSLPDLAAGISRSLAEAGIPHAVSGAIAMAAHGYIRATADLDLLVVAPAIRLPEVFGIVRSHGLPGEDRELLRSLRKRAVAVFEGGAVRVEILVPVLPYHGTLVGRSETVPMGGTDVPVVTIEDLVVLKLLWRRQKDLADIHALLQLAGERFDATYARETVSSILPDDDPRHEELRSLIERFAHRRRS